MSMAKRSVHRIVIVLYSYCTLFGLNPESLELIYAVVVGTVKINQLDIPMLKRTPPPPNTHTTTPLHRISDFIDSHLLIHHQTFPVGRSFRSPEYTAHARAMNSMFSRVSKP